MDKKKTAIILNASAGFRGTDPALQQIKKICHEYKLAVTFFLIHPGTDIHQIIKKAVAKRYTVIVAAGGDGTISAVARELVDTPMILGVLPLGTLNHFAKDIQVPIDLRRALSVLIHGEICSLDTASVNGRFFMNNSSIGLYPKIVEHRERFQQEGFHKWVAFLFAFLSVMRKNSFLHLRVISSEKNIACKTPFLFMGNDRYSMRGYGLGSRSSLTRGKLFLFSMHSMTRFKSAMTAMRALFGFPHRDADFDTWESREITVYTEEKFLQVALDGEIISLQTPLHYLIHPRSLRVIVPQKYAHHHSHF